MTLAGVEELDDVLASPVFGGGLPPSAERLLKEAGERYERAEELLALLREARKIAGDHFAVLIGLYRFFFYKGRLSEARDVAETCLLRAAIENSLPLDWRNVQRGDAAFDSYDAPLARFYVFVLKGYAYLNMRLGDLEEGRVAIAKLLELDPGDKVGARLLLDVLERREAGDDE